MMPPAPPYRLLTLLTATGSRYRIPYVMPPRVSQAGGAPIHDYPTRGAGTRSRVTVTGIPVEDDRLTIIDGNGTTRIYEFGAVLSVGDVLVPIGGSPDANRTNLMNAINSDLANIQVRTVPLSSTVFDIVNTEAGFNPPVFGADQAAIDGAWGNTVQQSNGSAELYGIAARFGKCRAILAGPVVPNIPIE